MHMGGTMHSSGEHSHCPNWDWQTRLDKLWGIQWQTCICIINWQVPLKKYMLLGSFEQGYLLRMICFARFPFESIVGKPKLSFWTLLPLSSAEKVGFRAANTSTAGLHLWRLQKRSYVLQVHVDSVGKWAYLALAEAYKCSSKLALK